MRIFEREEKSMKFSVTMSRAFLDVASLYVGLGLQQWITLAIREAIEEVVRKAMIGLRGNGK